MTLRVLVGDPGVGAGRTIAHVLERDGRFRVCATASHAAEAIALALAEEPHICLVDSDLPGGGLAAAWEITSRLPAAHVVILAERESDHDLLEAVRIGAAGYLVKDESFAWLPNALDNVRRGSFAMPRRLTGHVVQELRTGAPRRRAVVGPDVRLTSREWEVMHLIGDGLSTRQVAERLTLSPTAVRVHISAAVRKLGVEDRVQAIELLHRGRAASR